MKIYDHFDYDGGLLFKAAKNEVVDRRTTLFVRLEIAVQGNSASNIADPIADIFHLERISFGEPDCFMMVSEAMTLAYLKENVERIREVFNALFNAGMKAYDASCCELNIETPINIYEEDPRETMKFLRRACGIVYGFRNSIEAICGRYNSEYTRYYDIGTMPSSKTLDKIAYYNRHYDAVTLCNDGNDCPEHRTIQYRMFRSTLNVDVIMAYVELVSNIAEIAKSDKPAVTLSDLLHGEYISRYIEERLSDPDDVLECHEDETVYFDLDRRIDKMIEAAKESVRRNQSFTAIDEATERLANSLPASEERPVEKTKVYRSEYQPYDPEEVQPF